MSRIFSILLSSLLILSLGACAPSSNASSSEPSSPSTSQSAAPSSSQTAGSDSEATVQKTLYIGMEGNFKEYPQTFATDPTPDMYIDAIGEKTGWNLTRSEPTSDGKGGITVVFSEDSAIFTGPPDPQKDEFHVFEPSDLIFHILDSIQKTLQMNIIDPSLGDPSNLDVYFAVEGDKPLSFPDLGVDIPMDKPYQGSEAYLK